MAAITCAFARLSEQAAVVQGQQHQGAGGCHFQKLLLIAGKGLGVDLCHQQQGSGRGKLHAAYRWDKAHPGRCCRLANAFRQVAAGNPGADYHAIVLGGRVRQAPQIEGCAPVGGVGGCQNQAFRAYRG